MLTREREERAQLEEETDLKKIRIQEEEEGKHEVPYDSYKLTANREGGSSTAGDKEHQYLVE